MTDPNVLNRSLPFLHYEKLLKGFDVKTLVTYASESAE